jgi:hypothetical protein
MAKGAAAPPLPLAGEGRGEGRVGACPHPVAELVLGLAEGKTRGRLDLSRKRER